MFKINPERDKKGRRRRRCTVSAVLSAVFIAGCFMAPDRGGIHEGWAELTGETVRRAGGKISGCFCLESDLALEEENITVDGDEAKICLRGHVLKGTGSGSVISVVNGGKLEICDCFVSSEEHVLDSEVPGEEQETVYGGLITGGSGRGGAVYAEGCFVLRSGNLAGNSAGDEYGGAVFLADGSFIMEKGSILRNSGRKGGGVYVDGGCFTMKEGFIYRNTAGIEGGGVVIYDGTFIMKGGTVTENVSVLEGAGLYCRGPVFMGGKVYAAGNYRNTGSGRNESDVYLIGKRTISLIEDFPLEEGSLIGISCQEKPAEGKTSDVCITDLDPAGIFFSTGSLYETLWTGDRLVLKLRSEDPEDNSGQGEK